MREVEKILLARNAMATRFEIVLYGDNPINLRAAGEEALDEIERVEARISPFKSTSEIFLVNQIAYKEPVRVSPEVFNLLKIAREIWETTAGAFDITIGPLMKLWGFRGEDTSIPTDDEINKIKSIYGMNFVSLDEKNLTVKFANPEIQIDLGAIGKGYAIDQAVVILRDAGVLSAFIHGGTSTAAAIGEPPAPESWKISIEVPSEFAKSWRNPIAVVELKDNSLSLSGCWGRKSRIIGGEALSHIIDPQTGKPTTENILSAVIHKSATYSDALSTALLVGGENLISRLTAHYDGIKALIVKKDTVGEEPSVYSAGI